MDEVKTYIVRCSNGEFYSGKSKNIDRRMKQHQTEQYPNWFCNNERRNFKKVCVINGDFEWNIKRFGVEHFVEFLEKQES